MEPVKQHIKQFLGVLLVLIIELLFELCDDVLQLKGRNVLFGIEPQLFHKLGEAYGQFALGA